MIYNIIILGSGNLGSRYLEGMLMSKLNLNIYVIDQSKEALMNSMKLVENINHSHNVKYITNKEKINILDIDLLINSTSANNRYHLLSSYNSFFKINNFILEKVLSNNSNDLINIEKMNLSNSWVNTFLRTLPIFQDLKNKLNYKKLNFNVSGGGWGLCCNSIHYIDLVSWLIDSKVKEISTKKLTSTWFNSKRTGYKEINGVLIIKYENGASLNIECDDSDRNLTICLKEKNLIFNYDIISGSYGFNSKKGLKKIPFQSSMTCDVINQILLKDMCKLTPLNESLNQHKVYIKSMIKHWNLSNQFNHVELPIT